MNPVLLVAETVWYPFLRRREFYVLVILLGLYVVGAVAVQLMGVESDAVQRFLLGLGLALSSTLAAILTTVFTARQLPEEFENRTLYPLMAKPVSRPALLAGKFLASAAIGVASYLLFTAVCWLSVRKLPEQQGLLFVQALVLRAVSLMALAAFVLALSVRLPAILASLSGLACWFAGGGVLTWFENASGAAWISAPLAFVPSYSTMHFMETYVNAGPPLAAAPFLLIGGYGVCLAVFYYVVAELLFRHRAI